MKNETSREENSTRDNIIICKKSMVFHCSCTFLNLLKINLYIIMTNMSKRFKELQDGIDVLIFEIIPNN